MSTEKVNTLVVGAGQAGIAMSEHLRTIGESHLALERYRIAQRWRSERRDSLVANGPVWHDSFPSMNFSDVDPDAFARKENVADYFVQYAKMIVAPGTGQCPQDLDTGENIESNDPTEQTHKVMQSKKQLIEECGGQMQHLVKIVVYITDVRHDN